MISDLEHIKEVHKDADNAYHRDDFTTMNELIEHLFLEEYTDWLISQAETVEKIKLLVEDENITKGETVDKIAKLIF